MKKNCSLVAVTFILFNLCACGISYEVETPGVITREEFMNICRNRAEEVWLNSVIYN